MVRLSTAFYNEEGLWACGWHLGQIVISREGILATRSLKGTYIKGLLRLMIENIFLGTDFAQMTIIVIKNISNV